MLTGVRHRGLAGVEHHRHRRPAQDEERRQQDRDRRHLDFKRSDLFAQIFGRASDHQAGNEHRNDREHDHPVKAGAHAAEDDFAELDQPHRDHAGERHERIVHRIDRAIRRGRGRGRPQRRVGDAEPHLLAFHVTARIGRALDLIGAKLGEQRVAVLLDRIGERQQRRKNDRHRCQQRPALLRAADHATECVAERHGDRQNGQHLQEIRERCRVFQRVRRVDVVIASAVGAELLDRDLRGHRPKRNSLLGRGRFLRDRVALFILKRLTVRACLRIVVSDGLRQRGSGVLVEGLRDALPDQHQREDE